MNQKKFWKYFIRLWVWFAVLYHIIYSQSVKYDVTRRVVPSKSCCRASLPCYIWVEGRTFSASSLSNLFGDIFLLASTPSRKRKMRRVGRLKKQNYVLSFFLLSSLSQMRLLLVNPPKKLLVLGKYSLKYFVIVKFLFVKLDQVYWIVHSRFQTCAI